MAIVEWMPGMEREKGLELVVGESVLDAAKLFESVAVGTGKVPPLKSVLVPPSPWQI
jgi:hypothetical protein